MALVPLLDLIVAAVSGIVFTRRVFVFNPLIFIEVRNSSQIVMFQDIFFTLQTQVLIKTFGRVLTTPNT